MRNYNVYLTEMQKAQAEKLFFLSHLDLNSFDTIIDFGCATAEILKACQPHANARLIGIDLDPYMREQAHLNVPCAQFYQYLNRDMITEHTLIIFSSVLHEVGTYWKVIKKMIKNTGATVVVRDMKFSGPHKAKISKSDLSKLVFYSDPKRLADFIKINGLTTLKDMYHYLLKYSYVDNWNIEVSENYFSFDYKDLFRMGEIMFKHEYLLKFKKEKVEEDFHIELECPTHIMLIMKMFSK